MNLEIHNAELVQRVNARIESGRFHDVDELIERALDALDEQAGTPEAATRDTGAALLAVLRDSPYPDIDLSPSRVPLPLFVMSSSDALAAGHEHSVRGAEKEAGAAGYRILMTRSRSASVC